ncbi:MAG TPA: TetR/AcrR family transcriptional regulator [Mycobacteriales bacterium]|nr:TetR/AcrR family transcriptional regulator [Mycobacteriales bacterium]
MLDNSTADWRAKRRANATADIVEAAWELARENGLAGLSLRDLARRLGMAAPSLYSYFSSKHALYDAMFADGYRALLATEPPATGPDLRTVVLSGAEIFTRFALDDPVRFQLLNLRTIPGFEPSPEAYALAQQAFDQLTGPLHLWLDLTQEDLDLLTAFVGGLISAQFANEPGGTRWVGLLEDAIDLVLPRLQTKAKKRPATRVRSVSKEKKP